MNLFKGLLLLLFAAVVVGYPQIPPVTKYRTSLAKTIQAEATDYSWSTGAFFNGLFPWGIASLNGYYYTVWWGASTVYKHYGSGPSPIAPIIYSADGPNGIYITGIHVMQGTLYVIGFINGNVNQTIWSVNPNTLAFTTVSSIYMGSLEWSPGNGVTQTGTCSTEPCYVYYNNATTSSFKRVDFSGRLISTVNSAFVGYELDVLDAWRTRVSSNYYASGYIFAFDSITRSFRAYNGSSGPVNEWQITESCPHFQVHYDSYVGATEDGLHWLFDWTNGWYRGYDLQCSLTLNASDTVAPTATFPANVTYTATTTAACYNSELYYPNTTGWPTSVSDNCMFNYGLNVSYSDFYDTSALAACSYTGVTTGLRQSILRTWTVRDSSGNVATQTQSIKTYGYSNPTGSDPNDKYLELVTFTPTQECSVPIKPYVQDCEQVYSTSAQLSFLSWSETVLSMPTCTLSSPLIAQVQRTYYGTGCGNFQEIDPSNDTQTIWLKDTIPPVIVVNNYTWPNYSLPTTSYLVAADDPCDYSTVVSLTYIDLIAYDVGINGVCPPNKTLRVVDRVWTAVDTCGNSASVTQVITVVDNVPPTFTIPGSSCTCSNVDDPIGTTCYCGSPQLVADNCGISSNPSQYSSFVTAGSGCPADYLRTWTVVDNCGNTLQLNQTISA